MTMLATIIGKGPMGMQAMRALQGVGVSSNRLLMVDPHDEPAHVFRARIKNCVSESQDRPTLLTAAHYNVDVFHPESIKKFHKGSLHKPPLATDFFDHVDHIYQNHMMLNDLKAKVLGIGIQRNSHNPKYLIHTDEGDITTKHVILALGSGELKYPEWAPPFIGKTMHHILDPNFDFQKINPDDQIAIVGAGMNGLMMALSCANLFPGRVTLFLREPLEESVETSGSLFKGIQEFLFHLKPQNGLRKLLTGLSFSTALPHIHQLIKLASHEGHLKIIYQSTICDAIPNRNTITLKDQNGNSFSFDKVLLGTGFQSNLQQNPLLKNLIDDFNVPIAADHIPFLEPNFSWDTSARLKPYGKIFVIGSLAINQMGYPAHFMVGGQEIAIKIAKQIEREEGFYRI